MSFRLPTHADAIDTVQFPTANEAAELLQVDKITMHERPQGGVFTTTHDLKSYF